MDDAALTLANADLFNSAINTLQLVVLVMGLVAVFVRIGRREHELEETTKLSQTNAKLLQKHDKDIAVIKDRMEMNHH